MTVSPEVAGVPELIEENAADMVFAFGHSAATYAQAMDALRRGARTVTHPSTPCACFTSTSRPSWARRLESDAWRGYLRRAASGARPRAHAAQVQGVRPGHGGNGQHHGRRAPGRALHLGVNDVTVTDANAKLTDTGVRAGSTLTMIEALSNLAGVYRPPREDVLPC